MFKIVQSIHHIGYFAKKKTCQTRTRVRKPKGVDAPPTFPNCGQQASRLILENNVYASRYLSVCQKSWLRASAKREASCYWYLFIWKMGLGMSERMAIGQSQSRFRGLDIWPLTRSTYRFFVEQLIVSGLRSSARRFSVCIFCLQIFITHFSVPRFFVYHLFRAYWCN